MASPSEKMASVSEAGCRSSKHSSRRSEAISSVSSAVAFKRAQAEAARAGLKFVREEAELEAKRKTLELRKQVAVADAEARALQCEELPPEAGRADLPVPVEDAVQRTKNYIDQHHSVDSPINDQVRCDDVINVSQPPILSPAVPFSANFLQMTSGDNGLPRQSNVYHNDPCYTQEPAYGGPYSQLDHQAQPFYPDHQAEHDKFELTRFLLKKELLLTRLTNFDDKPESYHSWKCAFLNVVRELQVTPVEQVDLLVKWLGPESSRFAISMRCANAENPQRGLQRIWERLAERYGAPEMVEAALKSKLSNFPKISNKEPKRLYELTDLLCEVLSIKDSAGYGSLFAYFDSSAGVSPIVSKLPYGLQEKWTGEAIRYKRLHRVTFPPFSFFVEFMRDVSRAKNDPSFSYEYQGYQTNFNPPNKPHVKAKKTEVQKSPTGPAVICPLHETRHSLNKCRAFRSKPIEERKEFLKEKRLCYRCCTSTKHMAKDCTEIIMCADCGSSEHPTALHANRARRNYPSSNHGGEADQQTNGSYTVASNCTQICGRGFTGKSCGKTILTKVYPTGKPNLSKYVYAIIDDQSNSTLARTEFFEHFGVKGESIPYNLSSCSGKVNTSGRRGHGFTIGAVDGTATLQLPGIIECNNIPDIRDEIPTPEVARHHPHLHDLAANIPPLDENANILLLIGRDMVEAHHVLDQRLGPGNSPYAQKLRLGWVIIGETCLGKVHSPHSVNVNKTYLLNAGNRQSIFKPCTNGFYIREQPSEGTTPPLSHRSTDIFCISKEDNKQGMSIEDKEFLHLMDREFTRTDGEKWSAPLPFRSPRQRLPNNKDQAIKRAKSLHNSFLKNPTKAQHMVTFMEGILEKGHAEPAPPLPEGKESWYLPIFGVYHPKKPDQIRGVFDSSSQYEGISLNDVLLTGPDLTNSLIGILMRFRKEPIAVTADIEQMFYCFQVQKEHRDFLRFIWYKDNDTKKELIEYRMKVHVFGNSPSPAVATYGLRKSARSVEDKHGKDAADFVERNFYVDDGVISVPSAKEAIDLLKRTQSALREGGNLRLHKIASNSQEVLNAFPPTDLAKDLKDIDIGADDLPTQRSLGLIWDLQRDFFTFRASSDAKPYTKRGILSTVNSIFDPLGFLSPVILQGKSFLRDLVPTAGDWDEPLSPELQNSWVEWRDSLASLKHLEIPRSYQVTSLKEATKTEVHIFCDASEKAIAAVAYLKIYNADAGQSLSFVFGKAKLAPTHGHSIPRLELCAAVLACEIADTVTEQLEMEPKQVSFYTDSKVVLGYINNRTRRFYVYVTNRVERIRKTSDPGQWSYVSTERNPADCATRGLAAAQLAYSPWLRGPLHLLNCDTPAPEEFPLQLPEDDKEVRPLATVLSTTINTSLGSHRFERFSCWKKLIKAVYNLKRHVRLHRCDADSKTQQTASEQLDLLRESEKHIIREVQHDAFNEELKCLRKNSSLPKNSPLLKLNPMIDEEGLLRVGGRLENAEISLGERNPIIIPGRHHIATLLVRHYHQKINHQGRHFTDGAVRSAGFWVIGGKRLISSLLHRCVKCRRLRASTEHQQMSSLPFDRLHPAPPFTYVGLDVFGHWTIVTRRTRGGSASSKRWAVLFTCLTTRSVHIEVIEEMSASSFINALRRFIAIRGEVKEFRSDRGTNFIGAANNLGINAINVEEGELKDFLMQKSSVWVFNPPHASHMGGVWERMIGIARRILDGMLLDTKHSQLTHDVLVTLMAEVGAIINGRPITPVTQDPECPTVLCPSTLLTQKTGPSTEPLESADINDMYGAQWKRVRILADRFWSRWRREYLQTLQTRSKWNANRPNVKDGDVVLLKDKTAHRNDWATGIVIKTIPSVDHSVRKAEVRILKDGSPTTYLRPITDMVVLLSK